MSTTANSPQILAGHFASINSRFLALSSRNRALAITGLGLGFALFTYWFSRLWTHDETSEGRKQGSKRVGGGNNNGLGGRSSRGANASTSHRNRYTSINNSADNRPGTRNSHRLSVRNSDSIGNLQSSINQQNSSPEALVCSGFDNLLEVVKNWEKALKTETKGKPITDAELRDSLQEAIQRCQEIQTEVSQMIEKHKLGGYSGDNMSVCSTVHYPSTSMGMTMGGDGVVPYSHKHRTMSVLSDDSFASALDELDPDVCDVNAKGHYPILGLMESAVGFALNAFWTLWSASQTMGFVKGEPDALDGDAFQIPTFDYVDILGREPLDMDPSDLALYQDALTTVRRDGGVDCRVLRTDFLSCASDEDFLAKLICVRKALNLITRDEPKRDWLIETGRELISGLLLQANKAPEKFQKAYDNMLDYLTKKGTHKDIEDDLKDRKVAELSFYDVVLDFILIDAFDDLASPPSAVFTVTQSRFLSKNFKEASLATVVTAVIKSKRARLKRERGFIAHFYDISEEVSPTLAWGFLGSDEDLRELCYYFKDQIVTFLTDIFSFDRVRYTSLSELAEDCWLIMRTRIEMVIHRLNEESNGTLVTMS